MTKPHLLIPLILLACFATAHAEAKLTLTVRNDNVARRNTPIVAQVPADAALSRSVKLMPGDLPAQVERTDDHFLLRFVVPELPANETRRYLVGASTPSGPSRGFLFEEGPGYRELRFGKQPVYRYMMMKYDPADRDNTVKPFHHLYGLHEEGLITKGPGGMETHHRGLFFGFSTPFGNFWACKDVDQRHVKNVEERQFAGAVAARSTSVVEWMAKDAKPVVRDTREVTAWRVSPDEVILDFDITAESLAGDIPLTGDPHHGGFHFRAAEEVAEQLPPAASKPTGGAGGGTTKKATLHSGGATYLRPASARLIKDDNWSDCPWAACLFTVKNNPYVVVHMDDPANPKPTTYSTRPYGRFGAFFTTTLKPGQPLKLRYRVVLLDGKVYAGATADSLAPLYADFTSAPTVTFEGP
ncbi:MAG TPA: DUF6807 family protein [Tepidisphaeraceae bacterium]|jgi:hypothetical protein